MPGHRQVVLRQEDLPDDAIVMVRAEAHPGVQLLEKLSDQFTRESR